MFTLIKKQYLKNLDATYYEFIHEKTKAKHIHLAAEDKENALMIAFNTLPYSDNGIMHILEHCCMMGSKKFPVKGLLTSMTKNSLYTFANASTGANRTVYPVASANKKDFSNLADIYLDSAFFPLLKKETFLQEGWRYEFSELDNPKSDLKVNGVVYNEMIGAENSVNYKRFKAIIGSLYPDTPYAHISGGEPSAIPDLTYEEFKDYHKKYYHPSNATFLTYGDCNIEDIQAKFEENVLQHFDYADFSKQEVSVKQKPFEQTRDVVSEFGYKEADFADKHHYYKMWDICEYKNSAEQMTADIIDSLISTDASSVMLKALEDSKLVTHPVCSPIMASENLAFIIGGVGVKEENFTKLDKLIKDTLLKIVEQGFTKEQIEKVLHRFELGYKQKSNHRGSYGISQLYNISLALPIEGLDPLDILEEYKTLETLKEKLFEPNYLTDFIKEKLIDNTHSVNLKFMASNKFYHDYQENLANLAKDKQASLTNEEAQEIIAQSKALKAYQESIDNISTLPEFSTADIPQDLELQQHESINVNGMKISAFSAPTNGLTHFKRTGFLQNVKASELPYYTIYSALFSQLGYGEFSYEQRSENVANTASHISLSINTAEELKNEDIFHTQLTVLSTMLNRKTRETKTLIDEIINNLRFDEKDRIIKTLEKMNLNMQTSFHESGYFLAANIASAKIKKRSLIEHHVNQFGFNLFIKELFENINNDEVYNNLIAKLKEVHSKVVNAYNNSTICIVDTKDNLENSVNDFMDDKVIEKPQRYEINFDLEPLEQQAILTEKTTSNNCVMVMEGFNNKHKFAGALSVLIKIIGTNFMVPNIREHGGAYVALALKGNKTMVLLSGRDPNISKSFNVYDTLADWLQDDSNLTDEIIEQGILMAISNIDKPQLKELECFDAFQDYIKDIDPQVLLNYRKGILNTNKAKIKQMIKEYVLPNLKTAEKAALANKEQFLAENINWNTIEY